ncbi:unnamed protein product [Staurois parvus]|nr:unnamed protein product [Staurois parvus]
MNAAARIVHLTNRSVSSTPLCQSLHWPPLSALHPSLPIPPLASTQCPPPLSANPSTGLHSVPSHPSLPIPPLASTQCPPPLSANPSTASTLSVLPPPLCQSLHWPPLSALHPLSANPSTGLHSVCPPPLSANPSTGLHSVSSTPSLPIPPLASTQCPPLLSANPSTGLHSMSAPPPSLCQALHWPPLSVLHPSLPIPPLTSIQCPPPLSANPSTGLHSMSAPPPLSAKPSTGLHSVSSTPLCQSLH